VKASGNLFTYNVGPVLKYRSEHFEPFVEALFGGAHSNTYQNLQKACQATCVATQNPSNNAWDSSLVEESISPEQIHFHPTGSV